MKKSNLFFICCILAFSSACLKKDKGATSSGSTTTGSGKLAAVTSLVSPADPSVLPSLINYTNNAGTNPSDVSSINGRLATTRTHDITLTADVSTCTTSMSLDCEVNAGDAKVLNLTNFMNGAILIQ